MIISWTCKNVNLGNNLVGLGVNPPPPHIYLLETKGEETRFVLDQTHYEQAVSQQCHQLFLFFINVICILPFSTMENHTSF